LPLRGHPGSARINSKRGGYAKESLIFDKGERERRRKQECPEERSNRASGEDSSVITRHLHSVFVTEYSGREAAFGILRCAADPNGSWPPVSPAPGFSAAILLARARSPSRSRTVQSFLLLYVYLYTTRSRVRVSGRYFRGHRELVCLVLVHCHCGVTACKVISEKAHSVDRRSSFVQSTTAVLLVGSASARRWSRRSIGAWTINREGIPRRLVCVPSRSSVSEGTILRRGSGRSCCSSRSEARKIRRAGSI